MPLGYLGVSNCQGWEGRSVSGLWADVAARTPRAGVARRVKLWHDADAAVACMIDHRRHVLPPPSPARRRQRPYRSAERRPRCGGDSARSPGLFPLPQPSGARQHGGAQARRACTPRASRCGWGPFHRRPRGRARGRWCSRKGSSGRPRGASAERSASRTPSSPEPSRRQTCASASTQRSGDGPTAGGSAWRGKEGGGDETVRASNRHTCGTFRN